MRILIDSLKKRRYSPRQESHKAQQAEEDLPEESLSRPEDLTETIDARASEAEASDLSAGLHGFLFARRQRSPERERRKLLSDFR